MKDNIPFEYMVNKVEGNVAYERILDAFHGKRSKRKVLTVALYNLGEEVTLSELEKLSGVNKSGLFNSILSINDAMKNFPEYKFTSKNITSESGYIKIEEKENEPETPKNKTFNGNLF